MSITPNIFMITDKQGEEHHCQEEQELDAPIGRFPIDSLYSPKWP
jgi:hypothetical protein